MSLSEPRALASVLPVSILKPIHGRDPEFFSFYRSMQAYEAGLRPNDTRMLLKPDSDFFRIQPSVNSLASGSMKSALCRRWKIMSLFSGCCELGRHALESCTDCR